VAKVVKAFPGKSHRGKYPWDQWFDGQVWLLERGKDFDIQPYSLRTLAYDQAVKRGIKCRAHLDGNSVYIKADLEAAK
jgi:hypothetical protein